MQMAVSAPLANIFYTGMFFFILLILLGIGILFAYIWSDIVFKKIKKKK